MRLGPAVPAAEPTAPQIGGDLAAEVDTTAAPRRRRAWLGDLAAALVVLVALVGPDQAAARAPSLLLRLPLEAIVGGVVLLVAPTRLRAVLATILGIVLGLVGVLKLLDIGLYAAWGRPFDPLRDWPLLGQASSFLRQVIGPVGAGAAIVVSAALLAGLLVATTLSVRRLARRLGERPAAGTRTVAALTLLWVTCAGMGIRIEPGVSVASADATALVRDHLRQVSLHRQDDRNFEAAQDRFGSTPPARLLPALRGKDVIIAFVESYGRSAIEDPAIGPDTIALLDAGTRRLDAAGYHAESAFLTSPTAGGGSWLAQSTLLSGQWVDSQRRYQHLVGGHRLTLAEAFRRAGWRTVAVMPGNTAPWPESTFFGYDQSYDSTQLGYRGPAFSWATMPDQYALAAFQRLERTDPHSPLMAEVALVSSHAPWQPTPRLVPWSRVGDGSIFDSMTAPRDPPEAILTRDPARVRADYGRAIAYSLSTLIDYVETYGDDNTVFILLGDHQPSPVVTGPTTDRDVPVSIVTRDPAVLARLADWHWQDGLRPDPNAPVWRMDAFRDRFLLAFGSSPTGGPN
jgi:hypothetical protein